MAAEYVDVLDELRAALPDAPYDDLVTVAELPDVVRGYEDVKLRTVDVYRERMRDARQRLRSVSATGEA